MKTKTSLVLIGIMSFLLGCGILINPKFYHRIYTVTFDFTEIKWPLSIALCIFGFTSVCIGLRKKHIEVDIDLWICSQCQEPYGLVKKENLFCDKCGADLERMTGFYKRHPELKSN